ncbi:MAG: redoxin domain-containing protein [Acidimicrobiia bacterium]|nr:redoxin domain-containing protein [Acidimicrobiia bacterium]
MKQARGNRRTRLSDKLAAMAVSAGDRAPAFTLPDQDGTPVSLADLSGRWVVLWWYPAASTPG